MRFNFIEFTFILINDFFNDIDFEAKRFEYRRKIFNVIIFASIMIKTKYDIKYKFIIFKTRNIIYFRLYYDYFLLSKSLFKLFNQFVKSFLIKRKINKLIYKFELSIQSRIHSIIFIA